MLRALVTLKSSSSPGSSPRWRRSPSRTRSSTSSRSSVADSPPLPAFPSSGARALARIESERDRAPKTLVKAPSDNCTKPSCEAPIDEPSGAATPITSYSAEPSLMRCPTASDSGKRYSSTSFPMTQTARRYWSSNSVRGRPRSILTVVNSLRFGVTPWTMTPASDLLPRCTGRAPSARTPITSRSPIRARRPR